VKLRVIVALVLVACSTAHAQDPEEGPPTLEGTPPPPAEGQAPALEDPEQGQLPGQPQPAPPQPAPEAPAGQPPAPAEQPPPAEEPAAQPMEEPTVTFSEAPAEEPHQCNPLLESCGCPKNWGCWELLYTTPGTILGAKLTVTYASANAPDELDMGFVTFYSTEHYAARDNLSVHVRAFGGIGGGSANNEGSLGFDLDVGWRGKITETSGPFLRVGLNGMMMGHRAYYLSLFEPFQGRVGYQILDGDNVIEVGMTNGFIPVGHFDPGLHVTRDLSRTKELGGYAALHRQSYRADASFMHIFDPEGGRDRDDVELVRGMYCDYRLGITLCGDALFTRGEALKAGHERMTNSLYFGIVIGLSP
jgi:hypothetical protein